MLAPAKGNARANGSGSLALDDLSGLFVCPREGLVVKVEGLLTHGGSCGRGGDPLLGLLEKVIVGGVVGEIGMLPGIVLVVVEFPFPGGIANGPVA